MIPDPDAFKFLRLEVATDGGAYRGYAVFTYEGIAFSFSGKVEMLNLSEQLPFDCFQYIAPIAEIANKS